ncbi:cupin domain-containing protein [Nostocales cyanobacterium LEGE 11386]|nr:cupin domain-containing protein [Nostocales cyanobacterium LEGE 11386]
MTVITPERLVIEENPSHTAQKPDHRLWISEAGGLTQFGAFIEVLQPGSRSSLKHWHSAEDEMVYVLEGEIVLIEGDAETILRPGDAATFQAGVPVGHCLENRSSQVTRCLVVGTRSAVDTITYPDLDLVCHRDRALPDDIWTNSAGEAALSPY